MTHPRRDLSSVANTDIMPAMTERFYPLLFTPVYKDYIWGGQRIPQFYQRRGAPAVCAESWEISTHPDGMSHVAEGPFAGLTLAALATRLGQALTGTRAPRPKQFPLLLKLIDARENLSVQVHPGDENAGLVGGEPKTEMWCVLDRTPGALLYAGLKSGTTLASFRESMSCGTAPDCLFRLDVAPGDALFIPGGLVHAIGAGCLIYEVQQTSNTTYRLYDWGRFDTDGQPRPLHLQQAFQVINPDLPMPCMIRPPPLRAGAADPWTNVLTCRYFRLRRLDLRQTAAVTLDGATFYALFVTNGAATATAGGVTVRLLAGSSCLIPAAAGTLALEPLVGTATVLVTTLI